MSPAGRPEVGKPINIRLGDGLLARVDEYAKKADLPRAVVIRALVDNGLKKLERKRAESRLT